MALRISATIAANAGLAIGWPAKELL